MLFLHNGSAICSSSLCMPCELLLRAVLGPSGFHISYHEIKQLFFERKNYSLFEYMSVGPSLFSVRVRCRMSRIQNEE